MDHQDNSEKTTQDKAWERETLEKLVFAAIGEQTASRRWGIFFKSLTFLYLIALLGVAAYPKFKVGSDTSGEHTAVIDLVGPIAEGQTANAEDIIKSLRDAVKDENTKGIIFHANSPGGSPVQSAYVFDEIRKIKKDHPKLPIYAVVSDVCASGCYYIASASDKIFVNPASLIGSIGVLMDGFGFVDAMKNLGVERRLLTAGTHKAMLDPFSPPKAEETAYMKELLEQVHQQFITAVKTGRGDRLKETPDMFSGLVWTGEAGVKLGIADEFADEDKVAREIIGAEKRVDFTKHEALIDKLAGRLGAAFGQAISSVLQAPSLR
jgi:protease-4